MAGRKITKEGCRRLDKVGEEKIFETYIEKNGVDKMLRNLEPEMGFVSMATFYRWLRSDKSSPPTRWDRWQYNKAIHAARLAEEALQIADESEDAKLMVEHRRWLASKYDRDQFGKRAENSVTVVNVGDEFLSALKRVEEKVSEAEVVIEAEEAEYQIVEDE